MQNKDKKVIESFDKISGIDEKKWNHNTHYSRLLLRNITAPDANILDIGCGNGNLIKKAVETEFCSKATGVDFSSGMIEKAYANCRDIKDKCVFMNGSAYDILPSFKPNSFDAVFSVAAMHHMDYAKIVPLVADITKKGGTFSILDIYRAETVADYVTCALAVVPSRIMNILINENIRPPEHERELWDEHSALDEYMTLKEVREQAAAFPYKFTLKRLLYFRYMLTFYF